MQRWESGLLNQKSFGRESKEDISVEQEYPKKGVNSCS